MALERPARFSIVTGKSPAPPFGAICGSVTATWVSVAEMIWPTCSAKRTVTPCAFEPKPLPCRLTVCPPSAFGGSTAVSTGGAAWNERQPK